MLAPALVLIAWANLQAADTQSGITPSQFRGLYIEGGKAADFPVPEEGRTLTVSVKMYSELKDGHVVDSLGIFGAKHPKDLHLLKDPEAAGDALEVMGRFIYTYNTGPLVFSLDERASQDAEPRFKLTIGGIGGAFSLALADGSGPSIETDWGELYDLRLQQAAKGKLVQAGDDYVRLLPQGGVKQSYLCFRADKDGNLIGPAPGPYHDLWAFPRPGVLSEDGRCQFGSNAEPGAAGP